MKYELAFKVNSPYSKMLLSNPQTGHELSGDPGQLLRRHGLRRQRVHRLYRVAPSPQVEKHQRSQRQGV